MCRQLAGKLLQLEATVLARRIRPRTPSKKAVDASRGGSGPKSDRLSVRLALLDRLRATVHRLKTELEEISAIQSQSPSNRRELVRV